MGKNTGMMLRSIADHSSFLESLTEIFMDEIAGKGKDRRWTFDEILEICSARGLLRDGRSKDCELRKSNVTER